MHVRLRRWLAVTGVAWAAAGMLAGGPAEAAAGNAAASFGLPAGVSYVCPQATGANATCGGLVNTDSTQGGTAGGGLSPDVSPPAGLTPANLQTAYNLPATTASSGQTVAVVGAWDYKDAETDLNTYRSAYGIAACTTANGCFKKVSYDGGSTTGLPPAAGWDVGDAQAMDMISAVCPSCHILLVEANTTAIKTTDNPDDGLGAANNEAVALGALFVVDPWAIPESSVQPEQSYDDSHYFNHPGVVITASGKDAGFSGTVSYPAASPSVIAVGGTTLTATTGGRGYTEAAWLGTQSGCSQNEPGKPAWQTDTACAGRSVNDVAAVADPIDEIVYNDSDFNANGSGWGTGGGTDYAAAIVAAAYALDGPPAPGSSPGSYLYSHPGALYDISTGSTGTCSTGVLCDAGAGWDGPTGMGTPFGINAFHMVGARPVTVTATDGTTWAFGTAADGTIQADSLPSGSSTWSGLTSLGGDWPGYPTALATRDGSVWVFAIDRSVAGGDLWADQLPSGSSAWSGWTEIGDPGATLLGTPTALQDNTGQIDLFARSSTTGNLYETTLPSGSTTWSGFGNLGGTLPNDVAGNVGTGGWIYLMGVGNNSALYYDELAPGGSWTGWTKIGGQVTGVPSIIQDAGGAHHVFVREISDGRVLTSVLTGSPPWPALSVLGGITLNDPVSWGGRGGTNFVFTIAASALWYNKETGTTWSEFLKIQTGYIGVPGIVQDNGGTDHLVSIMTDGELAAFSLPSGTPAWEPPPAVLGGSFLQS